MNKKNYLICSPCKTQMEIKKTMVDLESNGILIRFRDVSTEVCPSCGMEYLPALVANYCNQK